MESLCVFLNVGAEHEKKTEKNTLIIPPFSLTFNIMFVALTTAKLRIKLSGGKGRDSASKIYFCLK